MRKRKAKRDTTTGRVRGEDRERERSPEELMRQKEDERTVLTLRARGATSAQIAEALGGVDEKTVRRIWYRAFDEYLGDHNKLVQQKLAEGTARMEAVFRTWLPKALGGLVQKRDADGNIVEVEVQPDPKAAEIVVRTQLAIARMYGLGQRFELTGANGGPIVTANATAQDAARLMRDSFGGKVAPYSGQPALPEKVDGGDGATTH